MKQLTILAAVLTLAATACGTKGSEGPALAPQGVALEQPSTPTPEPDLPSDQVTISRAELKFLRDKADERKVEALQREISVMIADNLSFERDVERLRGELKATDDLLGTVRAERDTASRLTAATEVENANLRVQLTTCRAGR